MNSRLKDPVLKQTIPPNSKFTELRNIRMLALDVDGTLTDGAMYYSAEGEVLKRFDTRDGHGIVSLLEGGIEVVLITRENSPIVTARAKKLGVRRVYLGCKDKLLYLQKLCREMSISLSSVAYVGDDVGDKECLDMVGFSACPADALVLQQAKVDYVCQREGGRGAVREVCDMILSALKDTQS